MLKLTEDTRDKIVQFISGLSVPVSAAPNFIGIVQALNGLEKLDEEIPEIEETKEN